MAISRTFATAHTQVLLNDTIKQRTNQLTRLGFKPFDVAYLVSAEAGNADVFLTTDDRLLKRANCYTAQFSIPVRNPANWFIEINQLPEESSYDSTP